MPRKLDPSERLFHPGMDDDKSQDDKSIARIKSAPRAKPTEKIHPNGVDLSHMVGRIRPLIYVDSPYFEEIAGIDSRTFRNLTYQDKSKAPPLLLIGRKLAITDKDLVRWLETRAVWKGAGHE